MPEKMVENICPVLGVSDLQTSIQFYTNILGFALAWGAKVEVQSVRSLATGGPSCLCRTPRIEILAYGSALKMTVFLLPPANVAHALFKNLPIGRGRTK